MRTNGGLGAALILTLSLPLSSCSSDPSTSSAASGGGALPNMPSASSGAGGTAGAACETSCDDDNPCTTDSCLARGECVHESVDCDDGNACNGTESCDPITGQCLAGEAISCDDGNICNGVETCEPSSGQCLAGEPKECDDGDICNGAEICVASSGACESPPPPQCPTAPSACGQSGGTGSANSSYMKSTSANGFRLVDQNLWTEKSNLISTIEAHSSVTAVSLAAVMIDLNRTGNAITTGLDCFHKGFEWNDGDNEVDYWWPQGVTGSTASYDNPSDQGKFNGKRVMLVSWYHKAEEDPDSNFYKGVRVSFVDHTYTNQLKYRHALLVEPVMEGGIATFKPLASASSSLHAGGIVWYKNWLYVASTTKGFRVFDLDRILKVQTGNKSQLGYQASSNAYHAYNYRYVVPQVGAYSLCDSTCCARFSFASIDTSTTPKSIVAGEYVGNNIGGRLHRWPLDETTGKLLEEHGGVQAMQAIFAGVKNMQGATSYQGDYFISSSFPKGTLSSFGSFHHGALGQSTTSFQYPYLPEDLYFAKYSDEIWTCTEYPSSFLLGATRYCLSYLRSDVLNGCP